MSAQRIPPPLHRRHRPRPLHLAPQDHHVARDLLQMTLEGESVAMDQSEVAGAKRPAAAMGSGGLGLAPPVTSYGLGSLGGLGLAPGLTTPAPHNPGLTPPPAASPSQIQALVQRIDQLEQNNRTVGENEHAAPLNVATAKLLNHVERRLASVEHDLGVIYQFQIPAHQTLPEVLKEGNRMYNTACEAQRGKKDSDGRPQLAPPCWGYVQYKMTEAMMADQKLDEPTRTKVDVLRRNVLGVEPGVPIPPAKLKQFMMVCSTATCHVTKKVAFVELRTHQRAPTAHDHPCYELRELFHQYIIKSGGVAQELERAPAPMSRDIRTTLSDMGYGPKGKGRGKGLGMG